MLIIFYRTLFLYFFITFILRFTGKRQLGEMSPSELVTAFLISNIAANPLENSDKSLLTGILPIVIIASLEVIMSYAALKSSTLRKILTGQSRYIIKDGRPDEKMMEALRISIDDLQEELRICGIFNIEDVEEAVVETNGNLSVLQKFPLRPLNNKDAGIREKDGSSETVVKDGKISFKSLEKLGIKEKVLREKLYAIGLKPEEIFILTMDEKGIVSYQRKEK